MSSEDQIVKDILNEVEKSGKFTEEDKEECRQLLVNHYKDVSLDEGLLRLERASVQNFETVEKREIPIRDEGTVLYGRNGTGKTSFIEALEYNLIGLPDSDKKSSEFELTNLIQNGKSSAHTNTYWNVNGDRYKIYRTLQKEGNSITGYPRVTKSPDEGGEEEDRRDSQAKVSNLLGIQPLEGRLSERRWDLYRIMGLFFITSKDWRLFMDWNKASDMLDILFRVNLTNVIKASENRIEEKYSVSEEARQASMYVEDRKSELKQARRELADLENERDRISSRLTDKQDQLESVRRVLREETEEGVDTDELQSQKSSLESREADLQRQLTDKVNELAKVRRLINRYEDTDLKEDMDVVGDKVRNMMSVPEKCPICTNKVESEDRARLLEDHRCPLCAKDMPEERVRVEKEYQAEESITAIQEKQQERLEDLEDQREDIQFEIESLEERIESTNEQIEQLEETLEEGEVADLIEEREELDREVLELKEDLNTIQAQIKTKKDRTEELEEEVDELETLYEEYEQNNRKREMLSSFTTIVQRKRDEEQRKLKNRLADVMLDLTKYFTDGTFADVENVVFKDKGKYSYEVYLSDGTVLSSKDPQGSTSEVVLHALLFHTAVLKELSLSDRNLPLRLFVIDSAFGKEQDKYNTRAIANFLSELPNILDEYQIIVSMAEIGIDTSPFEQNYRFEYFN
ncbi:chromosome segregation protein [Natrinema thermotolerans DSM 11552]|nr:chromosome segregation protein [Natrinema thermotolerans DSM 11552]